MAKLFRITYLRGNPTLAKILRTVSMPWGSAKSEMIASNFSLKSRMNRAIHLKVIFCDSADKVNKNDDDDSNASTITIEVNSSRKEEFLISGCKWYHIHYTRALLEKLIFPVKQLHQ